MRVVRRLLVILAVLLMPLGMAPVVASPSPADHHTMARMAMEHCPDQSEKHEHSNGLTMCSMVCASALPAQEVGRDEMPLRQHQFVGPTMIQRLQGILLEIATPPPKVT